MPLRNDPPEAPAAPGLPRPLPGRAQPFCAAKPRRRRIRLLARDDHGGLGDGVVRASREGERVAKIGGGQTRKRFAPAGRDGELCPIKLRQRRFYFCQLPCRFAVGSSSRHARVRRARSASPFCRRCSARSRRASGDRSGVATTGAGCAAPCGEPRLAGAVLSCAQPAAASTNSRVAS